MEVTTASVVVPGPDVYFSAAAYDRGHDVHDYSHRGAESRAVAHPAGGGRRRARGEALNRHNSLDSNRPDEPMRLSNHFTRFAGLLTIALLAGAWGILAADLHAAEPNEAQQKPVAAQRLFASPEEAVKALQAAAEAKDKTALRDIFGPVYQNF